MDNPFYYSENTRCNEYSMYYHAHYPGFHSIPRLDSLISKEVKKRGHLLAYPHVSTRAEIYLP